MDIIFIKGAADVFVLLLVQHPLMFQCGSPFDEERVLAEDYFGR